MYVRSTTYTGRSSVLNGSRMMVWMARGRAWRIYGAPPEHGRRRRRRRRRSWRKEEEVEEEEEEEEEEEDDDGDGSLMRAFPVCRLAAILPPSLLPAPLYPPARLRVLQLNYGPPSPPPPPPLVWPIPSSALSEGRRNFERTRQSENRQRDEDYVPMANVYYKSKSYTTGFYQN